MRAQCQLGLQISYDLHHVAAHCEHEYLGCWRSHLVPLISYDLDSRIAFARTLLLGPGLDGLIDRQSISSGNNDGAIDGSRQSTPLGLYMDGKRYATDNPPSTVVKFAKTEGALRLRNGRASDDSGGLVTRAAISSKRLSLPSARRRRAHTSITSTYWDDPFVAIAEEGSGTSQIVSSPSVQQGIGRVGDGPNKNVSSCRSSSENVEAGSAKRPRATVVRSFTGRVVLRRGSGEVSR
jgi:hypothetical protein